jgi:hypothetical protein
MGERASMATKGEPNLARAEVAEAAARSGASVGGSAAEGMFDRTSRGRHRGFELSLGDGLPELKTTPSVVRSHKSDFKFGSDRAHPEMPFAALIEPGPGAPTRRSKTIPTALEKRICERLRGPHSVLR